MKTLAEPEPSQIKSVPPAAPVGKDSPVGKFLERGGGLHHVCYQVRNLEEQLRLSREKGALVVREPAPAVAFAGRRIAWVFTKAKLLIEYLEA